MFYSKTLLATLLFFNCVHTVLGYTLPVLKRDSETEQHHLSDKNGAVASESAVCSRIGINLIKDGGNAADAVCSTFSIILIIADEGLLSVGGHSFLRWHNRYVALPSSTLSILRFEGNVGMYHSGIGGGGFMIVRSSNGSYEFIDFRETAPAAAFQDMYNNNTYLSLFGGLARYECYLSLIYLM